MRENPVGAPKNGGIKLLFDRRLRLEFRGAKITTDAQAREDWSQDSLPLQDDRLPDG